jgi:acetyl esterase/lipase
VPLSRRRLLGTAGLAAISAACSDGADGKGGPDVSTSVIRLAESYGREKVQAGEWFVPAGEGKAPTVVLVHGGFWRRQYDRHLEDKVALDLAGRGYLCWNIDYRSAAISWPATFEDAAAGYDHVFNGHFGDRVDPTRLAVVGHSAGGHLVAWLASRAQLSAGAPGYNADVRLPTLCVPQAGVVALTLAAEQSLGSGAPQALMDGTPDQHPQRYADGDPLRLLPTGIRSVLIHDAYDDIVPLSQSETYVAAAKKAGDDSTLAVVPGDHFSHIDPTSEACVRMRQALVTM